jgi:hypothetical protein
MTVPTGLSISGQPITTSGTLALSYASGYSIPTDIKQNEWNTAYNDKINNAAFTGTTTKTLTLTQLDGGTLTPTFTDLQGVTGVTGGTGLTGGTITTTGTLAADTNFLVTRFDTSAMLLPYLRKADTTNMLLPYFRDNDTSLLNLSSRFNAKVNLSDTLNMLAPYLRKADTTSMLLPYFRDADTTQLNLTSRFAAKQNTLNGTGFVKASGINITYDNSSYLRTGLADSSYLKLTGGTLTGDLRINKSSNSILRLSSADVSSYGKIIFNSNTPGFESNGASIESSGDGVGVDVGSLNFLTGFGTARTTRMTITPSGNISIVNSATIGGTLSVTGATTLTGALKTNYSTGFTGAGIISDIGNRAGIKMYDESLGNLTIYNTETESNFGSIIFSTGNTSGVPSERMRVTREGNVSIINNATINGTTRLVGNVAINTTTAFKPLEVYSSANDYLSLGVRELGLFQFSGIHFGYAQTNQLYRKSAIVFQRKDASDASGSIHILNTELGQGERSADLRDAKLTITNGGNVGINDTTPSYTLDVNGTLGVTDAVTLSTTTATPSSLLGKDGSNVVGTVTTLAQTGLMTRNIVTNASTISGSELINVTHGFTTEPTAVLLTVFGSTSYILQVASKNTSTFTVQVKNYDGTPAINATLISFSWLAIK